MGQISARQRVRTFQFHAKQGTGQYEVVFPSVHEQFDMFHHIGAFLDLIEENRRLMRHQMRIRRHGNSEHQVIGIGGRLE